MGLLLAILVGVPIVGAVVVYVRNMLRRHRPTPEQIAEAERSESPGAQLPTRTTELDEPVARDPDFELDAETIRDRQGT